MRCIFNCKPWKRSNVQLQMKISHREISLFLATSKWPAKNHDNSCHFDRSLLAPSCFHWRTWTMKVATCPLSNRSTDSTAGERPSLMSKRNVVFMMISSRDLDDNWWQKEAKVSLWTWSWMQPIDWDCVWHSSEVLGTLEPSSKISFNQGSHWQIVGKRG